MCGIVGYCGKKLSAIDVVVGGLQALEYRGYDSAGVAYADADGRLQVVKHVGRVAQLQAERSTKHVQSRLAIGHTRWATHGRPTVANAHPQYNSDQSIMVVHNGIIENYAELQHTLQKQGYTFVSQTDTEVVAHLLDYYYRQTGSFERAFTTSLAQLRGAYGLLVITSHAPGQLFAARLGSPLVIGVSGAHEYIAASDPAALLQHTKQVVYVHDHEYAVLSPGKPLVLHNLQTAQPIERAAETLDYDAAVVTKGDYAHFMLKEIHEAPQTIRMASLGRARSADGTVKLGGLESVEDQLREVNRIVIVACGTSYYAGLLGEYLIEEIAGVPVEVQLASEFKYRHEPLRQGTAVLAVSQSGETADTIAALKKVADSGVLRLGVVNVVGSSIARMTDAGVYCHAGPEQSVASTKAFVSQVTVLMLIAMYLGSLHGHTHPLYRTLLQELDELPRKVEHVLRRSDAIERAAKKYAQYRDFLYIGRGYSYPCALEGAIKLKEISYLHAEGYAAGEMKHGPLAMIDPSFPTFAVATDGPLLEKTYSNIQEIRARSGPLIAIGTDGNTALAAMADDVLYVPPSPEQTAPLLAVVVMQLFAYYVAVEKGLDIDRPRNLAKSVTVE